MATKEELFEAVRTIKEHCKNYLLCGENCPLYNYCDVDGAFRQCSPRFWPDPEEGVEDND